MIDERPHEPGRGKAAAFSLIVHLLLAAALFFGVQWKHSEPEVMDVELWSAVPVQATRLPPPPPPAPQPEVKPAPKPEPPPVPKVEPKPVPKPEVQPKKPDIAVKEEKKKPPEPKKEEVKKPEPKKPEPKPEPKPEAKPEPKKPEAKKSEPVKAESKAPPADAFKEMLERETRQRQTAEAQQRLGALADEELRASAARRGMESYATKIRNKIRSNIVLPPGIQGNPEAIFEVHQLSSGEVMNVQLKRSSGSLALDEAIERAIRKSSPLPLPDDKSLFEKDLKINYKLKPE